MNQFKVRRIGLTQGVSQYARDQKKFLDFIFECLDRHKRQDFGNISEDDKQSNLEAIKCDARVLSSYDIPNEFNISSDNRIWIITNANRKNPLCPDDGATTVLFPCEY